MNLTSTYLPRYTNYTMISGEPTLQPQDMYDKWNNPNKPGKKFMKKNPWNAPGSAPVYGEGCGVNGGNGDHDCNIEGGKNKIPIDYSSCHYLQFFQVIFF